MPDFVKVAKEEDIPAGRCRAVEVHGLKIAIFNVGGILYAVEDSCSHLGAPLSTGFLGKDSISCELHGATFDLRTGKALNAPAKGPVETFKVRVAEGDVEVEV